MLEERGIYPGACDGATQTETTDEEENTKDEDADTCDEEIERLHKIEEALEQRYNVALSEAEKNNLRCEYNKVVDRLQKLTHIDIKKKRTRRHPS